MVAQTFRKLGIRNELLEADLPPMVDLGLQKLYGFQHNDGGWGWWYDDNTDMSQTAYVLFGLAMTEKAGFDVDDGVMERGTSALKAMLSGADLPMQAYGAYVLAMAGEPVTSTLTLTEALGLDLFSQAALAIALNVGPSLSPTGAGENEALVTALLDSLRESASQDATTVHWSDEGDHAVYSRKIMGSTVRTTAMVASALARLDPESGLLPNAVRWLVGQRQGQGWGDTQRTSFAILALSDYLLASQGLASDSAYRVYLNDELWTSGQLDPSGDGAVVISPTASVSPSLLMPGDNQLQLVLGEGGGEPSGRLYYGVTLVAQRSPSGGQIAALQTHERSIGIEREYRLLDASSSSPAEDFQRGDLVEVQLTLDVPEESWYVVVDDPLPAGLEALNEKLCTTSHVAAAYAEPVYHWQEYGYNRKDVRDERVTFFITHLGPGTRTYTYLVRATTSGTFTALPAQVYPMYEPEVWSRSSSVQCHVGVR
jgi:uncharacterized protein YfaS (alpha-2-macroglobulin family)